MSAHVTLAGRVVQLDRPAEPDELITEEDAKDAGKLARLLIRILKDVATLKRRFWPRRIDYAPLAVDGTGTTQYRFPHRFGGTVRWWPVDSTGAGAFLYRHSATTKDVLVLVSDSPCTVTIRVEEAG